MANMRTSRQIQTRDGNAVVSETPLPWSKLAVLLAVRLTEPVGFNLILPFIYQMVGEFDVVHDPKDIAFYAGLLFTSFQFLRILTIMYWGILSDRIGRRPVVLIGLVGDLLTFALFGVSKSFTWALVVRCLNGFFTGSSFVIKPIAVEISDDTNRARVMAMLPFTWHFGSMLGGVVGGLLVDPVKNYPWLFGNSVLFREYPYLLPCLFGSAISFFGLVVGFFCLEETLVIKSAPAPINSAALETTPLVSETQSEEGRCENNTILKPLSKWDILTPTAIRILVTNTMLCLAISMHNQLYPIFTATDIADGGLGMDARTIGFTLALCSMFVIYVQLVIYPRDESKYGALACYRRGILWLTVFSTTLPFLSNLAKYMGNSTRILASFNILGYLSWGGCLFWGFILIESYTRMVGDILSFTSVNILVSNVAPRKNCLGFITGLQNQLNSIAFMVGPLTSGYLWSWSIRHSFPYPFNSHFAWIFSGILLVVTWYMTLKIPNSVNTFASGSDEQNRTSVNGDSTNARSEEPS